jgi:hypothetical protein
VPVSSPETLTAFLKCLRVSADTIDVLECQRLVRLLVKVILVDDHTIRHSIPVPPALPTPSGEGRKVESHRLRSGVPIENALETKGLCEAAVTSQ